MTWNYRHSPGGSEAVRSLVGLVKSRPEGLCRHSALVCTETAESRGPSEVEEERPPAEKEKQLVRMDVSIILSDKIPTAE